MAAPISERKISSILVEDLKHLHFGGGQFVEANVHIFLTTSDGGSDGPKVVIPATIDVRSSDTLENIYRALISRSHEIMENVSQTSPSDLYDKWLEVAENPNLLDSE